VVPCEIGVSRRHGEISAASLHQRRQVGRLEAVDRPLLGCRERTGKVHRLTLQSSPAKSESFARDVLPTDDAIVRERGRASEDIAKLSHIARPGLRAEKLERSGIDGRAGRLALQRGEQTSLQNGNVLGSLAQWRDDDPHLRQAVVEVLTKPARLDLVTQVSVRCRDHAEVDFDRNVTSHSNHLRPLEDTEELCLQRGRELSNLVDEHSATARGLEEPDAPLVGSGERALLVPEEKRLGQRLREGAGVDHDERLRGPGTLSVKAPCNFFFARSRLALNQHGEGLRGDSFECGKELTHGSRFADEIAERSVRAHRGGQGGIVSLDTKGRATERELSAVGKLDLRDAVMPEPGAIGASGVPNQDAVAHTPELEVHSADTWIAQHEIVGGMAPDCRQRARHGERATGARPGDGNQTWQRREGSRPDTEAFLGAAPRAVVDHGHHGTRSSCRLEADCATTVSAATVDAAMAASRFFRAMAWAAAIAQVVLRPVCAGAQSEDTLAEARKTFAQGIADEDAKRYEVALAEFRSVLEVKETANVRYRIATCLEALGRKADALASYEAAVRIGESNPAGADAVRASREQAARLDAIVARLTIVFGAPPPAGARVRVDDVVVDPASLREPIPLDPGHHSIAASAPGATAFHAGVTLPEGDRVSITVELPPAVDSQTHDGAASNLPHASAVGGGVALGAGGVLAAGAIVAWVLRASNIATLDRDCSATQGGGSVTCPQSLANKVNAAHDAAEIEGPLGIALTAAAVVAAGVGVWLIVSPGSAHAPSSASHELRITPLVATGGGGLTLTGSL